MVSQGNEGGRRILAGEWGLGMTGETENYRGIRGEEESLAGEWLGKQEITGGLGAKKSLWQGNGGQGNKMRRTELLIRFQMPIC